jgi:hypothetical protein
MRISFGLTVFVMQLSVAPAAAQTDRQVGVVIGYPAQVGVLWQLNDRVAIRPEVAVSTTTNQSGLQVSFGFPGAMSTSTTVTDATTLSTDIHLLFTVASWDAVKLYVTPGYGYTRSWNTATTTTQSGSAPAVVTTRDTTQDSHAAFASLGVQFRPHERFAVFGESGLRYSSTAFELVTATTRFKTHGYSTAGSLGVIFYF